MKKSGKKSNMGQGLGLSSGTEQGWGQGSGSGVGQGRNKGGSYGTGGFCICTKCGQKIPHSRGVKCTTQKCPKCGHTMIREEMVRDRKI